MNERTIYILIPAYNEEKGIKKTINDLSLILEGLNEKFKIVVINDGSTDNTEKVLEEYKEAEYIKILKHEKNKGVGIAFKTGFDFINLKAKENDITVVIDADTTCNLNLLGEMIKKIDEKYDIVIASRFRKGGGYRGFPFLRKIVSVIGNFILRILFSVKGATDYTMFYRAYNTSVIKMAYKQYGENFLTCKGFAVNAEILKKLNNQNIKVYEIPFLYDYRLKKSKSNLKIFKTIVEYFSLFCRIYKSG